MLLRKAVAVNMFPMNSYFLQRIIVLFLFYNNLKRHVETEFGNKPKEYLL